MQKTSALYKKLWLDPAHWTETRLTIGESGRLINERGYALTFGGTSILVATGGPDSGSKENSLIKINISRRLFPGDEFKIGCCVSGEIEIEIEEPLGEIPRQARLAPYVRLTNGREVSEWLPQGIFYTDTRPVSNDKEFPIMRIHGYDSMLKTEQPYPASALDWPAKDIEVVAEIAATIGVNIDFETKKILNKAYKIPYPADYSCREVLSYIAVMYGGWWIINNDGDLRLITISSIPAETRQLIDENGNKLVFGGDRINV